MYESERACAREGRRKKKRSKEEGRNRFSFSLSPTIVVARLRALLDFYSIQLLPSFSAPASFFLPSFNQARTLKLSLGGIGASLLLAAAAGAARGGRPDEELLLGAEEEASGGASADAAGFAAMLLLSAEATFLPAARAGEGCGEGERGGDDDAVGSLAGQSGRIGEEREARKRNRSPSFNSLLPRRAS